ncbi:MAG: L7Ae/L30e/S12e/Gadd45 family ribosomal protein [Oscillospiraceae bacterium]
MRNKALSLLGLCKKAGYLILGFDETARALEKGKAELLVLAADLSPKSAKEIIRLADRQNINAVRLDVTMEELWYTLGKRAGILTVTQKGLADKIVALTRARQDEEES